MIKKISIDGLLSFEKFELELRNLNVLIGANGSGKSNLIEVLSLLQALPTDLATAVIAAGGFGALLRKTAGTDRCQIVTELSSCDSTVRHSLILASSDGRYGIPNEDLTIVSGPHIGKTPVHLFQAHDGECSYLAPARPDETTNRYEHFTLRDGRQSVFTELRGEVANLHVGDMSRFLSWSKLYKDLGFGHDLAARKRQSTELPGTFLRDDAKNLALVINDLIDSGAIPAIEAEFARFYDRFRMMTVSVADGMALLNMHEEGLRDPVPAGRWSDGMIRYLCLLAVLCHPNPPPLICIDEPDLGFHPDIMHDLGRLIKSCAERTQVIITTHSKNLVDEFTDDPGSVIVCERDFDGATAMERLDAERLTVWLEDYTLGELWESGEIGGNPQ